MRKHRGCWTFLPVIVAFMLVVGGSEPACGQVQDPPPASASSPGSPAFGSHSQFTVVYASHFLFADVETYLSHGSLYLSKTPGTTWPSWWSPIDLPNGAEVSDMEFLYYDSTDQAGWSFVVVECETSYEDLGSPICMLKGQWASDDAATPGFARLHASFDPPLLIRALADADGNSSMHYLNTMVDVSANGTGDDLAFYGVAITWKTTVSPPPPQATYNDVPTDHWAFQFIEALSTAGITSGCGGRNYCPDNPITRAEMAVFLSAALGLDWPK